MGDQQGCEHTKNSILSLSRASRLTDSKALLQDWLFVGIYMIFGTFEDS
jgi:hypothetical protein